MTSTSPQIIKAEVGDNFFEIVDRLFDNAPRTVCAELIQNARRAGATKIEFVTDGVDDFDGIAVTVRDNGSGIENMADLLRIRGSGWDAGIQRREDPAGMGFFCLCRMKELWVLSNGRAAYMGDHCEALHGLVEVAVQDHPNDVFGTELRFKWPQMTFAELKNALDEVGQHAPISILIDDRRIHQSSFKSTNVLDEYETDDVKVYIYRRSYQERLVFNFHGLVVEEEMKPKVSDYAARVDVKETSRLQMVLPARNAIVRNAFFKQLIDDIRRRMYGLVVAEGSHCLPFTQWEDAHALGITLPPATATLREWGSNEFVPLDPDAKCCIMEQGNNRGKFESASIAMSTHGEFRLYRADRNMIGYEWYDAIPTVTEFEFVQDGDVIRLPSSTGTAKNLEIRFTLDWGDQETTIPTPIIIGHLSYGEDAYVKAVNNAGGFLLDPAFGLTEDVVSKLVDSAWKPIYMSDAKAEDWERLRTLDVRKCVVGLDNALEYALKTALRDTLEKTYGLSDYAGTSITLTCTIDDDGLAFIDRVTPDAN